MSDAVKLEQAIRIVLQYDEQDESLLSDAGHCILSNALEGKPFTERSCTGFCGECGEEKLLPVLRGGYLGLCAECAASPEVAEKHARERRG